VKSEKLIPEDDSVRLLSHILEGLNYENLYRAYSSKGRKSAVEPKILFKVITYAYSNNLYSTRKIEAACKRDINFMWLLEGNTAPDHSTIARFRKNYLADSVEDLFYQLVLCLKEMGEINFENIFVDGTKIEADANRYTFVWRKTVTKNEARMFENIQLVVKEINELNLTEFKVEKETLLEDLYKIQTYLNIKKSEESTEFVYGSGKRKTKIQKSMEAIQEFFERQEKYDLCNKTFEDRNSYSKTDTDATFMHMKEDHMRNSQLKPGYNVQIGVEAEYVVGLGVFSNRNDLGTLIPFLSSLEGNLKNRFRNVIADAGYESEENYKYLENHQQTYYIKPMTYEKWKKRSFKKDISKRENMAYEGIIMRLTDKHKYYSDEIDTCEILWMHFSGRQAEIFLKFIEQKYAMPAIFKENRVEQLIKYCFTLFNDNHIDQEFLVSQTIYSLITSILNSICRETELINTNPKTEFMNKAISYIDNNIYSKINLEEFAKQFNISKCHFCRVFEKYFNITPIKYVLMKKIEISKYMLSYTNETISSIASSLNFVDQSHFSKTFKRFQNKSPLQFRRKG